jgi:hypothetical protein
MLLDERDYVVGGYGGATHSRGGFELDRYSAVIADDRINIVDVVYGRRIVFRIAGAPADRGLALRLLSRVNGWARVDDELEEAA